MPPSASMTSQERAEYQKDRNRRKQQQFRARQKARLEELEEAAQGARASTSTSHSSDAQKRSRSDETNSDNVEVKMTRSEEALRRMEQRLLELGESESEILQLLDGSASSSSRSSSDQGPSRDSPRLPSNVARSSVFASSAPAVVLTSSDVTSISRFAALLNDFSPPDHSQHQIYPSAAQPLAYSQTSQPSLEVDRLRIALELSRKQPLPSTLPSWTYPSPVDAFCQNGSLWSNQQRAADWKWRLFELHRACHNNRSHPTEGYLRNRVAESTMVEIQLLIYQLLGQTSNQKDFYDAKRALSTEDRLFLDFTPLDPRIEWLPDPLVRVLVTKASRSGLLQLTELLGNGIETARIFGDVWRWDTWTMPEHSYKAPLPQSVHIIDEMLCAGGPVGDYQGAAVVGSSVRDIVLGLELPGWRTFDTGPIQDDNQKLVDYADKAKLWEKQLEARKFSSQGVLAGHTA